MTDQELAKQFCKLHLNSRADDDFDKRAELLLDNLTSSQHLRGGDTMDLSEEDLRSFVTYGCKILGGKNCVLKNKFSSFIHLVLINQQRTLDDDVLNLFTPFLMSCIHECSDSLQVSFLQSLGSAVYANGANLTLDNLELLIGTTSCLWSLLEESQESFCMQSELIQCIGNLCLKSLNGSLIDKSFIKVLYHKVSNFLRAILNLQDEENLELCKLVARTLKVLQTIMAVISPQDAIIEPDFAIAVLRVCLVYGLPGYQSKVSHLLKNLPSARTAPALDVGAFIKKPKSPLIKQAVKKKRKSKKPQSKQQSLQSHNSNNSQHSDGKNDHFDTAPANSIFSVSNDGSGIFCQSSSESEFSDSESGFRIHLKNTCCRIRQNTLKCIHVILKCFDRRGKISSWLLLLPETASDDEPSLIAASMHDASPKVRLLSLTCLIELINNSRPYLDAAVDRSQNQPMAKGRSFVPFSVKLNQSLMITHTSFLQNLTNIRNDSTIDKSLQCLSVLVLNTPYEKIGIDLLYNVVELVTRYISSTDLNVKISCLTCLAAAMSVRTNDDRIHSLMSVTPKHSGKIFDEQSETGKSFSSWIVRYCYQELAKDQPESLYHERICNQCLQVLKIVVQFYPCLISSEERKSILDLISKKYIKMAECMISFHSIKLIEEFGKYFARVSSENEEDATQALEFWKEVLDGPLVRLFQSQNCVPKIMSAACDALSTVNAEIFDSLNIRYQIMFKTLLLGAATDEDSAIKSAAVRALGILVTYPFVKEDDSFMIDVGRVIFTQLQSQFVNVRLKAGWALGNFTDSLIRNKSSVEDASCFSADFVYELLNFSKTAALDHDKVKPNGVRAIGSVLRWLPEELAEQEMFQVAISEAVDALVQNILAGPMKGRWNACYASSNMFQNDSIHLGEAEWTERILMALTSSLKECKNFKVRISAAVALCTPKHREMFGSNTSFGSVWEHVLEALKSSENLSDFTEYKFKDNLQTKICMLLCRLLNLSTDEDFSIMTTSIIENTEIIQSHIDKFLDTIVSDQNTDQPESGSLEKSDTKDVNVPELTGGLVKLQIYCRRNSISIRFNALNALI